jgi:hypothetical protein
MAVIEDVNQEIETAPRVADYVVDADVHVNPSPGMWREYLSPQFREFAPVVESDGEYDYIVFEGNRRKVNLMQSQAGRTSWTITLPTKPLRSNDGSRAIPASTLTSCRHRLLGSIRSSAGSPR